VSVKSLLSLLLSLLLLVCTTLHADERILSFHSDITINPDSSMQVVETIRVRAEQDQIRRGIYRDFPTTYEDTYGNRYRVDFAVQSVERDGRDENYFSEPLVNGVRTYIGNETVILPPGEYTYTITYTTGRQLGFFEDHDELYWNVTGNGWAFPIDRASARVFLPADVPSNSVTAEAWTGSQGSTEQAYKQDRFRGGTIHIETSRPLQVQEGLTIVVAWPKGFVSEPGYGARLGYFVDDNRHLLAGIAGLVMVLAYYLTTWSRVGRDPAAGVIIPLYQPPAGFSPASLRFIEKMKYDHGCFAAAIVNLAVKGYLRILEDDGVYTLERTGNTVTMSPGEAALEKILFSGAQRRTLDRSSHFWVRPALKSHEESLRRNYEYNYFVTNSRYFAIGLVLTLLTLLLTIFLQEDTRRMGVTLFATVWLSIWSFAVFFLNKMAYQAWRRVDGISSILAALHATVFAVIFTAAEVIAITTLFTDIEPGVWVLFLTAILTNVLFYEWMKAPTLAGRKLMDQIEGFRQYLDVAEKQELATRHPQGRTADLFEMYLPYALALGVEQHWAEKFADVLTKVSATGEPTYRPLWYSGAAWNNNHIGGFSSALASGVTQAIAASSIAPGRSSGGGGGGSSGGGGGGGGGGGW
jgi:uncharacterized membrane protein YgcG